VEPLRPDQQRAATLTLAEAFAKDPLLEIVAPDPVRRVKLGPPMMGVLLAYGMRYGRVWANDDASAVAIWLHPESGPMSMPRMLRAGMWRAPFMLGLDGMGRMSKAMSATEGFQEQVEGPHWYLMTVGTRTARVRDSAPSSSSWGRHERMMPACPAISRPPPTPTSPSTGSAGSRSSARVTASATR
jgi:hypothetical protein